MSRETVLVVGSGAREHAIAAALARSGEAPAVVAFGPQRNPGIARVAQRYGVGSVTDVSAMVAFARETGATLAVIGPEAPLAAGAADALWSAGVRVVGPRQSQARLESSKGFTRDLLERHGVAGNPAFRRFASMRGVDEFLRSLPERHVVKDDGLAGGKGVKVFGDHLQSHEESLAFCAELHEAGHPFVIEEKLEGEEFSLLSFCDGTTLRHMPAVQDHKRAYEGDQGPNTGGMGSYSDADGLLPFLTAEDVAAAQRINEQTIAALARETGEAYQGILYGGFMATRDGVRLIEYNARFGDPEALNLLTLLETDLLQICAAIADRTLHRIEPRFAPRASVCRYVVPEGYPGPTRQGDAVALPASVPAGVTLYLGGVVEREPGALVIAGTRAVGVTAVAATLSEAEAACERVAAAIPGPFFHRADIGTAAALERRLAHMRRVRGA